MDSQPIKILLIEDDPEYAHLIQALMGVMWDTPSELTRATHLSEGINLLRTDDFDVVLVDLSLPDSQNLNTFTQVQKCAPHIPLIVLSGLSDRQLALQAMRHGAQDYLVKGQVEGDLLVRSIRYAIERKRTTEELRKLAQEASQIEMLRELSRLKSELIANVSHELRTPLGLIKIFCTTLLREDVEFDEEVRREFLRDIDDETDKLERIVDHLLDLSRMESGRFHLQRKPTDMAQLAREVIADMQVNGQSALHQFVHDFPAVPLVAPVDGKRMEQVLRNLLSNAIKYSPDGGAITVCGRGDERQVMIWVNDQGIGIPAEELEKIFDRFYRVENEVTRNARGAGLGLAVCRGIVEAHGGRIWAESTPGKGSAFYFTLPVGER